MAQPAQYEITHSGGSPSQHHNARTFSTVQLRHTSRNQHSRESGLEQQTDPDLKKEFGSAETLGEKIEHLLGLEDFMNPEVWKKSLIEFAGTMVFEFAAIVGIITCLENGFSHPRVAAAVAYWLAWAFASIGVSTICDGHLNPTFSFVSMLAGNASLVRGLFYMGAQCSGAILGAYGAKVVLLKSIAQKHAMGACLLGPEGTAAGFEESQALLVEFGFSFLLILVAFPVALEPRNLIQTGPIVASFVVGGALGFLSLISSLLRSDYPGAGMNPARCLGPAVVRGGVVWECHWVHWAGPILAAILYGILYHLSMSKNFESSPNEEFLPLQHIPAPPSPPERRMDVFLHIKAMMQRSDSEKEKRRSRPLLVEDSGIEQA